MSLSKATIFKIAEAIKPEVIDYIYSSEEYATFMHDATINAVSYHMGEMDEEIMFELSMLMFDCIELK